MTTDPPKVNPDALYSASEAIKFLKISSSTFYLAVKRGSKRGGIDYKIRKSNGRKTFSGKEILRFWAS